MGRPKMDVAPPEALLDDPLLVAHSCTHVLPYIGTPYVCRAFVCSGPFPLRHCLVSLSGHDEFPALVASPPPLPPPPPPPPPPLLLLLLLLSFRRLRKTTGDARCGCLVGVCRTSWAGFLADGVPVVPCLPHGRPSIPSTKGARRIRDVTMNGSGSKRSCSRWAACLCLHSTYGVHTYIRTTHSTVQYSTRTYGVLFATSLLAWRACRAWPPWRVWPAWPQQRACDKRQTVTARGRLWRAQRRRSATHGATSTERVPKDGRLTATTSMTWTGSFRLGLGQPKLWWKRNKPSP